MAEQEKQTFPSPVVLPRLRRARLVRRIGLITLGGFVGLGALGTFGVRSETVRAASEGYVIEVGYPAVIRPGLTSSWSATVRRAVGFSGPVTLTLPQEYLELFDYHAAYPAPTDEVSAGDEVWWTFAEPAGETLRVQFDARIAASVQSGAEATTRLLVQGREVVRVRYATGVMP